MKRLILVFAIAILSTACPDSGSHTHDDGTTHTHEDGTTHSHGEDESHEQEEFTVPMDTSKADSLEESNN